MARGREEGVVGRGAAEDNNGSGIANVVGMGAWKTGCITIGIG
jgi:hypothetical protein